MKLRQISLQLVVLLVLVFKPSPAYAQDAKAIVHAVLFYSPSCGHCHYVITEILPPLFEKYGEQLQIIGLDVTQPQGQELFLATMRKFGLESEGVPFLVIDNLYLVGSLDIPEKFPGLVETYLAQGGVDWPDIPGLQELLAVEAENPAEPTDDQSMAVQGPPAPATVSPSLASPTGSPGILPEEGEMPAWLKRFANDLSGNTLALLVLAGMIGALVWVGAYFPNIPGASLKDPWAMSIPVLCAVGLAVAGYLAYVETTQVTAVCGPVGDCNTVQQSEYARLFGVLPVGVLGLLGYISIIAAWLIARYTKNQLADLAVFSLFIMTLAGTLFSVYLTFLEPFVIGATCAWCLTSSVLMTILMLLSARVAKQALLENPMRLAPSRSRERIG